ncbi:hypothetical protein SRB5_01910 [Streptomyces sp. RB5]|uniref:Uncharacterized protein n=1 Tax=Streptomyces smaragdinus TaxID=2585196 RepID=A0A7K0C9F6_9ACTN|nr:hypothetical protein [Streptomyces smaragdinus]MQY10087.1 hypothetical protein [Streptomyces smaragdinus]
MSDDVLSIIPSDPRWQPDHEAAESTVALVETLAPGAPDGDVDVEIETTWHDGVTLVDCGANLERIGCPLCREAIDTEWWRDLMDTRCDDGFATLVVEVPCCGGSTTLDALDYDWPCGFASFEVAVWNPGRASFSDKELAAVADVLGHPVRQIWARI